MAFPIDNDHPSLPKIAPLVDGRIQEVCNLGASLIRNEYQKELEEATAEADNAEESEEKREQEHDSEAQYASMSREELVKLVVQLKKQVAELQKQVKQS